MTGSLQVHCLELSGLAWTWVLNPKPLTAVDRSPTHPQLRDRVGMVEKWCREGKLSMDLVPLGHSKNAPRTAIKTTFWRPSHSKGVLRIPFLLGTIPAEGSSAALMDTRDPAHRHAPRPLSRCKQTLPRLPRLSALHDSLPALALDARIGQARHHPHKYIPYTRKMLFWSTNVVPGAFFERPGPQNAVAKYKLSSRKALRVAGPPKCSFRVQTQHAAECSSKGRAPDMRLPSTNSVRGTLFEWPGLQNAV